MSLYEYWCEQYDPQPVGSVELNTEHIAQRNEWAVLLKVIAAFAMTAGLFWLPFHFLPLTGWHSVAVASGIVLIYVGLAFFFVPRANTDNMGWLGGMVDDPFHISDDWNRSLMFYYAVLGPGRFIAGTLLDVACVVGVAKSDPIPMSDEYFHQQLGYSDEAATANATMTELPSESELQMESGLTREEANQQRYGLSSAKYLLNDDE